MNIWPTKIFEKSGKENVLSLFSVSNN